MLTITALLLALNAAAPASCSFFERVGRMSFPEETSPAKARFRAVKKEAMPMPAPTAAPEYPELGYMPLPKRGFVGTDTCGYHTDDGIEITCGTTATCTNSGSYRDCCLKAGCTTSVFRTACFDSTASECRTRAPSGAHCCTYDYAQYCATYIWSTSDTPGSSFTLIACESTPYAGVLTLSADFPSDTTTGTGPTTTRTTSSRSSRTTDSSSSTGTSSTGTGTSPPSPTQTDSGGSGSAPVGAIVGGVVGGLAVIGIAVIAIVFFLRSKRSKPSTIATPSTMAAQPSMYGGPPPGQSPPPQMVQSTPPGFPPQGQQAAYGVPNQYGYANAPSSTNNMSYASPNSATGLFPGQPASPDPSKHYSAVSSESPYGVPPSGPHSPPPQQYQAYNPNQHPHQQVAEMGATNPMGSYGNRAELG